jgi:hypothetical protein
MILIFSQQQEEGLITRHGYLAKKQEDEFAKKRPYNKPEMPGGYNFTRKAVRIDCGHATSEWLEI